MGDFLLELLSEEIPARMQAKAAEDLRRLVVEKLAAEHLAHGAAESWVTPRRLGLAISGLPERQPDRTIETKGPRDGAPEQAVQGFLRSAGLTSLDQCEKRDTGKGVFWFALKRESGETTEQVLARVVPAVLDAMPWPKSMRWAGHGVRWVRPLHSILALLDGRIVPIAWALDRAGENPARIEAGDVTRGHRFMAPEPFQVGNVAEYRDRLADRFVILDREARKERIEAEGRRLAGAEGLTLKDDPALLDEVAGLVEWPVVRLGRIEPRFMSLPPEVLTTSMRSHQKYFACESADGTLAPFFVVVGNRETRDGGAQFLAGNERVLRARLSDAEFFWNQDRETSLESRVQRLGERVFHAKLGSVLDKVERMVALTEALVPHVPGADAALAARATRLAKADLSSALVGEFPELQGIMGRYLALNDGEDPAVAEAIALHYAPAGLDDPTPTAPTAIVVSLADKIDTLVGFFAAGILPTGSKDPFALRRAALGIIRLILDNRLRLPLEPVLSTSLSLHAGTDEAVLSSVLAFFADRLAVALREQGIRHDLITAVFALGDEDDLVRLVARTRALQDFLANEDGANLLTAYRRAAKIVEIEARKDGADFATIDRDLLAQDEERSLLAALQRIGPESKAALDQEHFVSAMSALAGLRGPLDSFFEAVTVNAEDPKLRANRLALLGRIKAVFAPIADFSRIEG
jgi:glycyl-tRNA synthetase beta chain